MLQTYGSKRALWCNIGLVGVISGNVEKIYETDRSTGTKEEIKHFANCILGLEKLRFPPEEAYKDLELVMAIYKAIRTNKKVRLEK